MEATEERAIICRADAVVETQPGATDFNISTNVDANIGLPEGLTPQQGQAAVLLASGIAVQDVADHLGVHRTTLWHWRKLETFQAFMNAFLDEAKQNAVDGLMALQANAIATVSRVMTEGSDSAALKAACYVIERVSDIRLGSTEARELVRQSCSSGLMDALVSVDEPVLDERAYRERCEELGIEPE